MMSKKQNVRSAAAKNPTITSFSLNIDCVRSVMKLTGSANISKYAELLWLKFMFVLWSLLFIYHLFPNPLTYVNQSTLYNSPVIVACSSLLCGTMRTLRVLTLLSAAVLLCSAAPGLEPLTCSEGNGPAAADKAVHHINEYHDHGYKFRLHEVQGNSVEQVW